MVEKKCCLLLFLFYTFIVSINAQVKRVPSTKDIEDYDDPVLREIFKKNVPPNPELLANNNGYQQQYYNQNGYQSGGGQVQPYSQGNGYSNTQQRYQSQPSFSNSNNQ
uniref:Uncharacterized protein n=1 Tax=Panagrolaimus sp. PS1159 TaxID=55785 RepID=A0AC35F4S8_9BILA